MKKACLALALAASLALSSCALFSKKEVYPAGVQFPLSQAATVDYAGEILGRPVADAARIYWGTNKGLICAVDLAKRASVWQFVSFSPLACPPVLSGEAVVALDAEGGVYALAASDGRLLWHTETKEAGLTWLAAASGRAIAAGPSGLVLALSVSGGRPLWRYQDDPGLALPPVLRATGLAQVLLFGTDASLQFLNLEGQPGTRLHLKVIPSAEPLLDRNWLYFGGTDRKAYGFDLNSGKISWSVKLPGVVTCLPLVFKDDLFLWTSHGALYCMDRTEGDILWWKSVASRLSLPPLVVLDKVVASVSSPKLSTFDLKTGKNIDSFDVGLPLTAAPLWVDPYLVVNGFDSLSGQGKLLFLTKEVSVSLKASKESPQGLSDEIVFVAKAVGFFKPQYEFYLTGTGPEEIAQAASDENNWSWYPDKEGDFKVRVLVTDKKQKAEAQVPYTIKIDKAKKEAADKAAAAAAAAGTKPADKTAPVKKPPGKKPPIKK